MKVFAIVLTLVLGAVSLTARSVHNIQTYGIVDKVVFEPNEKSPQRIKVWGTFAFLYAGQDPASTSIKDGPNAPNRGYLYFKLPQAGKDAALKEWADLKAVAGTGQLITFGSWESVYWGTNGKVRRNGFVSNYKGSEMLIVLTEKDGGASPTTYTMDTGIVKLANSGSYSVLLDRIKEAARR